MAINVTINFNEAPVSSTQQIVPIEASEPVAPFPPAGIDAFLSHFVFTVHIQGKLFTASLPSAVQTVSRSAPFVYQGGEQVAIAPIPKGAHLSVETISEREFPVRPKGFFESGKEQIWLEILNLDVRGDTEIGPVRFILGDTLKREYPDLFDRSLGIAQSIGKSGLPARLFFSPAALIEAPFGKFKLGPKALVAGQIDSVPPNGAVRLQSPVDLFHVEDLRKVEASARTSVRPSGQIVALAHPIDATLLLPGDQAFTLVNESIRRG